MLKYIDTTGRNEEEAIAAALAQLGLDRDDVSVEILDRAKSGFLGIGGNPAKVRVTYEVEGEDMEEEPIFAAEQEETVVTEEEPAAEKVEPAAAGNDKAEKIAAFLVGLMEHMQVNAIPTVTLTEEGIYHVDLQGENLGAIIGRRGETLDAIQQLTSYSINRGASRRVRIQVDAENYRAKREEALIRLAKRVAEKVVKYRRNVTLEPMNAYERHVIHTALQDYPGVTTYSTGTEPNRRTVVAYEK